MVRKHGNSHALKYQDLGTVFQASFRRLRHYREFKQELYFLNQLENPI